MTCKCWLCEVKLLVIQAISAHHFHNLYFCFYPEVIEEHLEVFLHLDRIILHLCNCEDAHAAVLPSSVLLQQEWQQHE